MSRRLRLDLGSGPNPHPGFTGVDLHCDVDLRVDLRQLPWTWADRSVSEVWCSHYVEHQTGRDWIYFVDELWRILKPGAKATIIHPNLKSERAFQDPTHLDFIPSSRWNYTNREWRKVNDLDHPPYPTCDFEFEVNAMIAPGWETRSTEALQQAASLNWDVVFDLQVLLTKRG